MTYNFEAGMLELRVFWDKWRLTFDRIFYCENETDRADLIAVYVGPFVFAWHRNPSE